MNTMLQTRIVPLTIPSRQEVEVSVLKALAYYDVFNYPLTKEEIRSFSGLPASWMKFDMLLNDLLERRIIFRYAGFYLLHPNPFLAYRRKAANARAQKLLPKAMRIGRFLYRFPFVRAIGISGSLSKNVADKKADIDFFIITKSNRLWIARTIMHIFKKLTFLIGHQHYFCMNYYVDEAALEIEAKNIFTAVEIATLLPVAGKEAMSNFFLSNSWAWHLLPSTIVNPSTAITSLRPWYKKFMEWIFDHRVGDWVDDRLWKITSRRWKAKNSKGKTNSNGHSMLLETGKHFSRSNPGAFQEKVLSEYEARLESLGLS